MAHLGPEDKEPAVEDLLNELDRESLLDIDTFDDDLEDSADESDIWDEEDVDFSDFDDVDWDAEDLA